MAEHDHSAVLEQFRQQESVFRELYALHEKDALDMYFESLRNLGNVFQLGDRCFRCIDERTPGGIHAAGPVILFDKAKGIDMLKRARAEGIYSHVGCGAAGIAFESLSDNMKKFYVNSDNYGMFYAKRIAKEAGIPYMGHLGVETHFHVARMAIYDGTGCLDSSKLGAIGLPPAFVISRRYHAESATAMREASIAAAIATGSHGYGSLIKDRTPFILLAVGTKHKESSLNAMMDEAKEVAKDFDGKVIVDGFVAPV